MKFAKNILSGLCILAFLSQSMLIAAAAQDSDGQARSYCVRARISPAGDLFQEGGIYFSRTSFVCV